MYCCEERPTEKRIDPDTGDMQISTDGGVTWTPDPESPKYAVIQQPPPIPAGYVDSKCDAATNALQHIQDIISETSSNIATAGSIYEFAVIVCTALLTAALVFITGGTASPLVLSIVGIIWGGGSAVFAAGQAAFDDYWTSDNLDIVLCALYDNIGEDGAFTEDQYQGWRSQVKFELPSSPARDLVMTAINALGAAGLSNMASYGGASESDCSDCLNFCGSNWVASDGTIINVGDGYIDVQAGFNSGNNRWMATIHSPGLNSENCCTVGVETLSGDIDQLASLWRNCGAPGDTTGLYSPHCVYVLLKESTVPFTARFLMSGGCEG